MLFTNYIGILFQKIFKFVFIVKNVNFSFIMNFSYIKPLYSSKISKRRTENPSLISFDTICLANSSGYLASSFGIYVRISRTRYLIVLFQQFCVGRYLPSLTTPATRILQCSSFTAPTGLMSP